jgi:hypothetical protein
MTNRFYLPERTYIELDRKSNFDAFMKDYIEVLQKEFKTIKVKVNGYTYSYYTCDQIHDPRDPSWKPFKILSQLCKKYDYDFFIVKEIIEEQIGRKLTCKCQVLNDEKAIRRRKLESVFGVGFEGLGRKDFDLV